MAPLYEDQMFAQFAAEKVHAHPTAATPLLLFFAPHAAHTPLQAREETLARFDFIAARGDKPEHSRQTYTAMMAEGDAAVGTVVAAFKAKLLWENTLFIWVSEYATDAPMHACCDDAIGPLLWIV